MTSPPPKSWTGVANVTWFLEAPEVPLTGYREVGRQIEAEGRPLPEQWEEAIAILREAYDRLQMEELL